MEHRHLQEKILEMAKIQRAPKGLWVLNSGRLLVPTDPIHHWLVENNPVHQLCLRKKIMKSQLIFRKIVTT